MEFIKKLFNDDDKVIGLCSFKKKTQKIYSFTPSQYNAKLVFNTNTKNNFLLS